MWTSGVVKGANERQLVFKVKGCHWQLSSKVKEANTICGDGRQSSVYLSEHLFRLNEMGQSEEKKGQGAGNMAAIVGVGLRDSQKRQSHQSGPAENSLNGVCEMCVCVCVCVFRAARTKKCQHFFFQVPISICIISFYRKLKRKAGDAGTKTQIDEETMVARRVDVWGRTFSKWWFHIVSRGFATARSGRGVCARGLTLSSRPLKKIMAFISLVSFFWLCRTPKLSSSR